MPRLTLLTLTTLLVHSSLLVAVSLKEDKGQATGQGQTKDDVRTDVSLTCLSCAGRDMSQPESAPNNTQACTIRYYDASKISTETLTLTPEEQKNYTLVCYTINWYASDTNQGQSVAYRGTAKLQKESHLLMSARQLLAALGVGGLLEAPREVLDLRLCNTTKCNNNVIV